MSTPGALDLLDGMMGTTPTTPPIETGPAAPAASAENLAGAHPAEEEMPAEDATAAASIGDDEHMSFFAQLTAAARYALSAGQQRVKTHAENDEKLLAKAVSAKGDSIGERAEYRAGREWAHPAFPGHFIELAEYEFQTVIGVPAAALAQGILAATRNGYRFAVTGALTWATLSVAMYFLGFHGLVAVANAVLFSAVGLNTIVLALLAHRNQKKGDT